MLDPLPSVSFPVDWCIQKSTIVWTKSAVATQEVEFARHSNKRLCLIRPFTPPEYIVVYNLDAMFIYLGPEQEADSAYSNSCNIRSLSNSFVVPWHGIDWGATPCKSSGWIVINREAKDFGRERHTLVRRRWWARSFPASAGAFSRLLKYYPRSYSQRACKYIRRGRRMSRNAPRRCIWKP